MNPGELLEMGSWTDFYLEGSDSASIRNMVVSNKRPLAEDERRTLLEGFKVLRGSADRDYRTTQVIWSTGCHPWSLQNSDYCRWKVVEEGGTSYVDYLRAKTYEHTHLVLDPAIATWLLEFLRDEGGYTTREYHRRVKTFGLSLGLDGLCPRALRHDRIFLTGRACGWDLNALTAIFGTDASTLLGYMATDRAKTYSDKILREAFG